ncbi:hypothetical protein ALC53_02502, partial [Atta colombica]
SIRYCIFNFSDLSNFCKVHVKCKVRNSKIRSYRRLGLKILIVCLSYNSVPLGIGLNRARKFCGLMDLPPPVAQSTDVTIKNIHKAASFV